MRPLRHLRRRCQNKLEKSSRFGKAEASVWACSSLTALNASSMDVLSEEAEVLQTAFPGSNREVVTNVVNFCLEPHPVAALIKPLQFSWDSHQWPDGKVTYWIKIEGPSLRACFLNDHGRPMTAPEDTTSYLVNSWWPSSFRCRRDSIGYDHFRREYNYWGYASDDERRFIPGAELTV